MITHFKIGFVTTIAGMTMAACTALGVGTPSLASDCAEQGVLINQATAQIGKMTPLERSSIEGQINLSRAYCAGTLPADQTAASKAVQASTAQIGATVAVVALRK